MSIKCSIPFFDRCFPGPSQEQVETDRSQHQSNRRTDIPRPNPASGFHSRHQGGRGQVCSYKLRRFVQNRPAARIEAGLAVSPSATLKMRSTEEPRPAEGIPLTACVLPDAGSAADNELAMPSPTAGLVQQHDLMNKCDERLVS